MRAQGGQGIAQKQVEVFALCKVIVEDLAACVFAAGLSVLAIAERRTVIDVVGRIREDHIRGGAVHQQSHIGGDCGVPAHEAMTAKLPDVAALCGGGFDFCGLGFGIEVVFDDVPFQENLNFLRGKAGQVDIHGQGFQLDQDILELRHVPFAGDLVEGQV